MKYETIDRLQIDDIMEGRQPRPPANWEDNTPSGSGKDGWNSPERRINEDGNMSEAAQLH